MRSFKRFPKEQKCVICNTNDDKEGVLVPISGTQEGLNAQALPIHLDCIDLWYYEEGGKKILAQIISRGSNDAKRM